ncbi:unnamed protein product [Timema podura]|uniref:Uncharacterized protein n=1 Tax=Timema podura TaxID=61482 RepID=A0ABN7ND05_TIMPD|nr:unnamed protein product [Timema podura]
MHCSKTHCAESPTCSALALILDSCHISLVPPIHGFRQGHARGFEGAAVGEVDLPIDERRSSRLWNSASILKDLVKDQNGYSSRTRYEGYWGCQSNGSFTFCLDISNVPIPLSSTSRMFEIESQQPPRSRVRSANNSLRHASQNTTKPQKTKLVYVIRMEPKSPK